METFSRRGLLAWATLLLACGIGPALAADAVDMAAAKKEGKVVWYTSGPVETAQKISNLFAEKTGIKVELFRSGGSNILRRFQQEADGGKIFVDVLTHSEPAAARMMTKKGLFVPFKATDFDKVPKEVKDPDGYHVAQRLNVMAIYLRAQGDGCDRPRPVRPRPAEICRQDGDGTVVLVAARVHRRYARQGPWLGIFRAAAQNDIMLVQGNQQVSDMLKRGERAIAVGADAACGRRHENWHADSTLYPTTALIIPRRARS